MTGRPYNIEIRNLHGAAASGLKVPIEFATPFILALDYLYYNAQLPPGAMNYIAYQYMGLSRAVQQLLHKLINLAVYLCLIHLIDWAREAPVNVKI